MTHKVPFWPTLWFDEAGSSGSAAPAPQQSDELPAHLQGKFVPKATFDGTVGGWQAKVKELQTKLETRDGEFTATSSQLKTLQADYDAFKTEAQKLADVAKRVPELEGIAGKTQKQYERLKAVTKYPQLLEESTLALIESSTLEGEELTKMIEGLAAKLKTSPEPVGASPAAPAGGGKITSQDLLKEAEQLRRKGDVAGFNAKMTEALALKDAESGKSLPPEIKGPAA